MTLNRVSYTPHSFGVRLANVIQLQSDVGVCRHLGFLDSDYSMERNPQLSGPWIYTIIKKIGSCVLTAKCNTDNQYVRVARITM